MEEASERATIAPTSSFLSPRNSHMPDRSSYRHTASTTDTSRAVAAVDTRRSRSTNVTPQGGFRGWRRFEARRTMDESHFMANRARSKNLNPPVDLRQLIYVSPYDDNNLSCPICRCPFVDPVVLTECDHCFCRDCIRQTWTDHNPLGPCGNCPSCRTPAKLGPRSATNKIIVNILDDLEVQCPKHDQGCTTIVKRGEVQDHVSLYCGFGMVECTGEECMHPVLRKDASEDCLHYPVSCIDCHQAMFKSELGQHWKLECPDRKMFCTFCSNDIFYRDFDQHSRETCPAISVPCPGHDFGCTFRSKRTRLEAHTEDCALAKLAPFMNAQKQRLDEHEAAQRQMSRKLELLEQGLANIQVLLDPNDGPDDASADESRIPFLSDHARMDSFATAQSSTSPIDDLVDLDTSFEERRTRRRSTRADYDDQFPPPTTSGPFTSPIHHLLSMHEALRDEVTRMSAALSELDGRQSMLTLNEGLRTREEIAYIGGQVAGMSRQVHWLTSAHLQRQQGRTGGAADGSNRDFGDNAAGVGVEAAVNAVANAASALRGAARIVTGSAGPSNAREGIPRRGTSEEGRTKL